MKILNKLIWNKCEKKIIYVFYEENNEKIKY